MEVYCVTIQKPPRFFLLKHVSLLILLQLLPMNHSILNCQTNDADQQSHFDNPFTTTNTPGIEAPSNDTAASRSLQGSTASKNPFAQSTDANVSTVKKPPFWYPFVLWQKSVNNRLSVTLRKLKDNFSLVNVLLVFIISLAYSLMHTAGPGHGKLILGTYFLTSDIKRQKTDAVIAGVVVSLTHIGMAFILSLVLYLIIHSLSMGHQRDMAEVSRRIGGIFVVLTGVVLMSISVFKGKIPYFSSSRNENTFNNLSLITIAILSGIVPCPLAWFVLVFSISYGIYMYGIISIIGMAIGAALTVGTTGFLILLGKEKAFGIFKSNTLEKAAYNIRFAGGCVLLCLGILMTMPS